MRDFPAAGGPITHSLIGSRPRDLLYSSTTVVIFSSIPLWWETTLMLSNSEKGPSANILKIYLLSILAPIKRF